MKNNEFFEVNCAINGGEKLTIKIPMTVHPEFQLAVSNTNIEAMSKLTELFAEFSELNDIKRMTFQALVEKRAGTVRSFSNMLELLKATKFCTLFFGE